MICSDESARLILADLSAEGHVALFDSSLHVQYRQWFDQYKMNDILYYRYWFLERMKGALSTTSVK